MGEVTRYPNGTFCWIELITLDAEAARAFYADLFGWTLDEPSARDDEPFTMCRLNGQPVAGIRESTDQQTGWLSFVSSSDVEGSSAAAERLGGAVLIGPRGTTSGSGLAAVQDPSGASFVLWHSDSFAGARWVNEVNTWSWNELLTTNVDAATAFYSELFGWSAVEAPPLDVVATGRRVLFGRGDLLISSVRESSDPTSRWTVRFRVADTVATTTRIEELGGRVLLPATPVPLGSYAEAEDPEGARFSLIAAPAGGLRGLDRVEQ
jgi:uncharacterized protein